MSSYAFGKVNFDEKKLEKDLQTHTTFPKISEEYDEFSSGFWMNCTLWGASEDEKDTQYRDYNHEIKQTSYGKQLPYISNFIQENFNIKKFKNG